MLAKARAVSTGIGNPHFSPIAAQSMAFVEQFDLVFSNSALQWVPEEEQGLVMRLVWRALKPGGRIAVQVLSRLDLPLVFPDARGVPRAHLGAGLLSGLSAGLCHPEEVLDWWASAGLKPYLAAIPEEDHERLKEAFARQCEQSRTARGIEFDYRRVFALATKSVAETLEAPPGEEWRTRTTEKGLYVSYAPTTRPN